MAPEKSKAPSAFEPALRNAATRNKVSAPAKENRQQTRTEDLAGAAVASPGRGDAGESAAPESKAAPSSSTAAARALPADNAPPADGTQLLKTLHGALQAVAQDPHNGAATEQLQAMLRNTLQMLEQGGAAQGEALAGQLQGGMGTEGLQKLQDMLTAYTAATGQDVASMPMGQELGQESKAALAQVLAALEQAMRQGESNARGIKTESAWAQVSQPEVVEGFVLLPNAVKNGKAAGTVDDPRFAELLNKPVDSSSLREQQQQQEGRGAGGGTDTLPPKFSAQGQTQTPPQQTQSGGAFAAETTETQTTSTSFTAAASPATSVSSGADGVVETLNPNFSADVKVEGLPGNSTAPGADPSVITLKNGATMPMARVVDQTIQHLSLHARGDSSVVTVRLHPEELGELNIRMVMEGDQLKLQIQAQNQQVREILEQNFPRLRTAMEDQGVTVEDFQVSLGSSGAEEQAHSQGDDNFSQHNRAVNAGRLTDHDPDPLEMSAPQHAVTPGAGGLSVHV
ncbi:MAG: flagellar hook-length control protein FliK [Desulfuromonas sp.]